MPQPINITIASAPPTNPPTADATTDADLRRAILQLTRQVGAVVDLLADLHKSLEVQVRTIYDLQSTAEKTLQAVAPDYGDDSDAIA